MRPDDLTAFVTLSDAILHPDGIRVVFVVSRMDLEHDRYDRAIWLWDGTECRPFTHGPADTRPRWSPDGSRLAFLRASGEEGEPSQVAVMSASGGEAVVVTEFARGAEEAEWSPDGSRLAVLGVEWASAWADLDDEERSRSPVRIIGPGYRFDTIGSLYDRRRNVYVVDPSTGAVTAVTDGDVLDRSVVWHPDGEAVGFISARHDSAHLDAGTQPWEVPVGGGDAVALADVGYWDLLTYRPDGVPHLVGLLGRWDYPAMVGLWRLEDAAPVRLAEDLDRAVEAPTVVPSPRGPQWLDDGSCRCVVEDRGTTQVIEIRPDGSWDVVAGGPRVISSMTANGDGSVMVLVSIRASDPGELVRWERGAETTLSDLNGPFRATMGLVEPEHFVVEHDGADIDAWAYLPPGEGRVPLLLSIHGGPATQYGWGFFDEFQVYAGAGLGVVACNPRGSSGRGDAFVRVPVGRWAEDRPPDMEDLLAVADAALQRFARLDPDRQGIMGGSYGGFMTARILAEDGRWASAVPERGVYSFTSFAGTSDIGHWFPRMYIGERGRGDWDRLWAAGPLSRAHRITTPCLIIHSEADFRCPIEQAEQLFAVLVASGVEVEMLRFPGSSHELSRSGKPRYRKERFDAILAWHARHLGLSW
jgi:dipeptidyl aminopeptidase/acylaminoacyl peptidase